MASNRDVTGGGLPAEAITNREFNQVRRGYDPIEVKRYLHEIADDLARLRARNDDLSAEIGQAREDASHPVLTEEAIVAAVGEEMATTLRSAHAAATDMKNRAAGEAERLVAEARSRAEASSAEIRARAAEVSAAADSKLAAIESEAEGRLSSAAAEAEGRIARARREADATITEARQTATSDAARIMAKARTDAESARQQADQERRATVEAAQAIRERILGDLARRRRVATVQIEQLRAGRERLLESYAVVRRTLDEVSEELQRADAEARAAADEAGRRLEAREDEGGNGAETAPGDGDAADDLVPTGTAPLGDGGFEAPAVSESAFDRSGDDEMFEGGSVGEDPPAVEPRLGAGLATPGWAHAGWDRDDWATGEPAVDDPSSEDEPATEAGPTDVAVVELEADEVPAPNDAPTAEVPAAQVPAVSEDGQAPVSVGTGDSGVATDDDATLDAPTSADPTSADPTSADPAPGDLVGGGSGGDWAGASFTAGDDSPSGPPSEVSDRVVPGDGTPVTSPPAAGTLFDDHPPETGSSRDLGGESTGVPQAVLGSDATSGRDRVRLVRGAEGPDASTERPGPTRVGPAGRLRVLDGGSAALAYDHVRDEPPARAGESPSGLELVARPADSGPRDRLETLFERIRSDRERSLAETAAARRPPTVGSTTIEAPAVAGRTLAATSGVSRPSIDAESGVHRSDADESELERREAGLDEVLVGLTRRMKRALQDEHNDLLDRLRSVRGTASVGDVLGSHDEQIERYRLVARPFVEQAATSGVGFLTGETGVDVDAVTATVTGPAVDGLAVAIVQPLRARVEAVLGELAGEGSDAVVDALASVYRELRSHRLEPLVTDSVSAAHTEASWLTAPAGATLRWVADDAGGPCPDCDDNTLAGAVPKGDAFPTGQLYPPAHPGCRCLLVLDQG